MENIGTWNSDLLFIFTAALLLPIVLYFVGAILSGMESGQYNSVESETEAWTQIKQRTIQNAINGDADARDWVTENVFQPKSPPKTPKSSPVTKQRSRKNAPSRSKRSPSKSVSTKPKPAASKPKPAPVIPKPAPVAPKPKHNTSPEVTREAIQGLTSLGFRKKEAATSVKEVTKNKSYTDAGAIIQDLFDKKL